MATQGTWKGVYGTEGGVVVNGGSALPGYATLSSTGTLFTWASPAADLRAALRLQGCLHD